MRAHSGFLRTKCGVHHRELTSQPAISAEKIHVVAAVETTTITITIANPSMDPSPGTTVFMPHNPAINEVVATMTDTPVNNLSVRLSEWVRNA